MRLRIRFGLLDGIEMPPIFWTFYSPLTTELTSLQMTQTVKFVYHCHGTRCVKNHPHICVDKSRCGWLLWIFSHILNGRVYAMCNRLSLMTLRSVQKALSGNRRYLQFTRSISILADRCNAAPVFRQCYVSHDIAHNKTMGQNYSTSTAEPVIPIVTYDEVKDLPNHPEKTLIDVREPHELQETGIIPTATNIPCKINVRR